MGTKLTNEEHWHVTDAMMSIIRLLEIVLNEVEITPLKRRVIRQSLDSLANLEVLRGGRDELPLLFIPDSLMKKLDPYLLTVDAPAAERPEGQE